MELYSFYFYKNKVMFPGLKSSVFGQEQFKGGNYLNCCGF